MHSKHSQIPTYRNIPLTLLNWQPCVHVACQQPQVQVPEKSTGAADTLDGAEMPDQGKVWLLGFKS